MGALATAIFGLLAGLPGMLGDYFKSKQELEKAKLDTQLKIELEKQRLATEMAKADVERATASLGATGQWFKYCVFWLLSSPFIACLIGFPEYAEHVFGNLDGLPQWYLVMYTGIVGVIFGIPVPGSIMGNIWDGIKEARANTRQFKLDKIRIDRQAYWEDRRKEGKISQQEVDTTEKVFDTLDSGAQE